MASTNTNTIASEPNAKSRAPVDETPQVELTVVIPAYNEENGISDTIDEVRIALADCGMRTEIVVVDDGSTDGTLQNARATGVRVLANPENSGYGAALKHGITSTTSPFVAIIDADGSYPAESLQQLLELAGEADMVVGDRGAAMKNVPLIRRPAKFMLNTLANYLARRRVPDINSGLRVFRRKSLEPFLPLLPSGFSFTTTITLGMICSGLRVKYLPIEYRRRVGKSKIRPTDFFAFVLLVLRIIMLFDPLRVFLPLGSVLIALGGVKFCYDIFLWNLSESAVLAILAGLMAWSLGLIADMINRLHLRPHLNPTPRSTDA